MHTIADQCSAPSQACCHEAWADTGLIHSLCRDSVRHMPAVVQGKPYAARAIERTGEHQEVNERYNDEESKRREGRQADAGRHNENVR